MRRKRNCAEVVGDLPVIFASVFQLRQIEDAYGQMRKRTLLRVLQVPDYAIQLGFG